MKRKLRKFIQRLNSGSFSNSSTRRNQRWNWKKIATLAGISFLSITVLGVLALATTIAILSIDLPDVNKLDQYAEAQSSTIYDRKGNVLYVKYGAENREYVPLSKISPDLIHATISAEDKTFYEHNGFDITGIARAAINNITGKSKGGGSTITQQYIKLALVGSQKDYIRKLKELILAVKLEQTFTKDIILEKYLNKISYGNNAHGPQKAAEIYFDKKAQDLDIVESVILAGIPQQPNYFSPFGNHKYSALTKKFTPEDLAWRNIKTYKDLKDNEYSYGLLGKTEKLDEIHEVYIPGRVDYVINKMTENKYITEEQAKDILKKAQTIEFKEKKNSLDAPHFVLDLIEELEKKYGKDVVEQGGLKIYTTIDPDYQKTAQDIIKDASEKNEKNYNVKNSALIAMNPKNGQILAMVGSRNYWDEKIDGKYNIINAFRQPGSSFKPFVYAKMFYNENAPENTVFAPASIVFDVPTSFGTGKPPKNFDGKFLGPMSVREALGQSRNIPAIKAYFLAGEQEPIIDLTKKMGLEYLDEKANHGYPLALGSAEVTPLSMATAYSAFANGGKHYAPVSILKIENAKGEILEEWKEQPGEDVLDPQIGYLITSILSDDSVKIGPNLIIPDQVIATKTGTSNRENNGKYLPHDLWTMGYSTNLVVGVWSGNNDDKKDGPLSVNADGYNVSAPIFKKFMTEALKGSKKEEFPIPEGIKQLAVSKMNGKLAGELTPIDQQKTDFFASIKLPTETDESFTEQPDYEPAESLSLACAAGSMQKKLSQTYHDINPEREEWEKGAQEWLMENKDKYTTSTVRSCRTDNSASSEKPHIEFTTPKAQEQLEAGSTVSLSVVANAPKGIAEVHYYLNGSFKTKTSQYPYSGSVRLPKRSGKFEITARVYDTEGRVAEAKVEVES